jgi:hypothetical protein
MGIEQITGGMSALHDTVFGGQWDERNNICVRHDIQDGFKDLGKWADLVLLLEMHFRPSLFSLSYYIECVPDTYRNISIWKVRCKSGKAVRVQVISNSERKRTQRGWWRQWEKFQIVVPLSLFAYFAPHS